ncbi:MAG: FAD-dependent oxidoreductase [Burkholderiaceae bacterium]
MRVALVGAGIVGVTTAYELAADGHDVSVFERTGGVASETSFANAGVIAPGYVTPWAAPGMAGKVLRHLLSRHTPVRLHAALGPATIGWLVQWWRASRLRTYQANRARMQRLAVYSRERLHHVSSELRLDWERSDGYLVLLRSARDLALARPGLDLLERGGTRFALLDAAGCRSHEPGLNPETDLHAGIHLPDDEVGNCRQFAYLLREEAQRLGARFAFHTRVERIEAGAQPGVVHRRMAVEAGPTTQHARALPADPAPPHAATEPMPEGPTTERYDAVIVCAGVGSRPLLRPLGVTLPLLPVYGYSVTAPLRHLPQHPDHGPRSGVMDERYKVAISRLGQRVRVAGCAEIGGAAQRHNEAAIATLYKVMHDWFPGSALTGQAQHWKGARPMLPDGPPVIGRSGADGVWLNLGHGGSGWALACGSARLLGDLVAGRTPAIDTDGLGIERLRT